MVYPLLLGHLLRRRLRRPPNRLEAKGFADFDFQVGQDLGIVLQVPLGGLPPLPDPLTLIGVPSAGFFDNIVLGGQVQDRPLLGDPFPINDVELGLPEGRRKLVLHYFDLGPDPDGLGAVLDGVLPPDVEPYRGVELERAPAGGRLRRAEHHAYLFTYLVDEDHRPAGARDGGGELAQGLGHEARLQAREGVAHVAVQLRAWHERGHRVDHDDVHGVGAHEGLRDLERLLTRIGLGDEQLVGVDPEILGVLGIERVLGVDEGGGATQVLRLRDDVERQRGLAGRLRPVDLGHPAAGNAADAQRDIALGIGGIPRGRVTEISSKMLPWPRRMMAPLPNWRSIEAMASSRAWRRSLLISAMLILLDYAWKGPVAGPERSTKKIWWLNKFPHDTGASRSKSTKRV